ncbi:MAG: MFS transporter [Actinobacteria bacterium]|nr:MFS transporter [Actinomycetota bacterium]
MRQRADERTRVGIVARLWAAFGIFGVFWGGWGALLPDVQRQVSATDATLGRALLFIALGAIGGMLLAGRVADRFRARTLLPGALAFAVTIPPLILPSSLPTFLVALTVMGAASGAYDVFINGSASVYETIYDAKIMGGMHALFSAGVLVSSPLVGVARQMGAGPAEVLPVLAVLVVIVGLFLPGVDLPTSTHESRARVRLTPQLMLLGTLCALAFLIEDGLLSWSAIHLERTLGGNEIVGGLGPGVLAGSMVAGRALTQAVSRRFSERQLIGASGLFGTAGATVFALTSSATLGLAGIALTGLAISVVAPLIFGVAGRVGGPGRQASSIARVSTIAYFGFVVGPALVGGVAGAASLPVGLLVMTAAALLLAAGSRLMPV